MQKILFLILSCSFLVSFGQSKQVVGTMAGKNGISGQLKGDYYSFLNNNNLLSIGKLDGSIVSENINVQSKLFQAGELQISSGSYFEKTDSGAILKSLEGNLISEIIFNRYKDFKTDNTVVEILETPTDKKYAYIDTAGKILASYDRRSYYSIFGIDITKGYHNTDKFIAKSVLFADESFQPFSEGLAPVQYPETGLWGFVNEQLTLVVPAKFKKVGPFFQGKAVAQNENNLWGYIDQQGKEQVPFTFSIMPSKFSSGLAKVTAKNGKNGYIDSSGRLRINPTYQHATDFYKGFALVRENFNSPIIMIDSTGKTVAEYGARYQYFDSGLSTGPNEGNPFHYTETLMQMVDMGKAVFFDGSRYGILSRDGKVLLPFEYGFLKDYADGKMLAFRLVDNNGKPGRKYYVIKDDGTELVELVESQF